MKKNTITLLWLILITNVGFAQSEKIKIQPDNPVETNYLKMDDFYTTHYLYIDLFLRENLFPEATADEVSSILKAMKKYVSSENKLSVEIERPGNQKYLIRFVVLKRDDGTELLIAFTNWTVQKRKFETEIDIKNNSYTRWYFLNGNRMTYRKDMSDQNDYTSMSQIDLANAFIFDELPENDAQIKPLLDTALELADIALPDKIMGHLILLKYYIFQKDSNSITKQVKRLEDLFEENASKTNINGLKVAFDATKFQIELME
jgi:hypothetical protein